ncbi:unnamed protein product [Protopolystoma xenopodis]|uniref:Uncharacterized protein n=1 Tax=Protopolystoma xenopodis TaxID=117903 RepID=A0A3S5CV73_9PLAT|nr:unnamed protein product [Protopolystoma xenopodis]
MRAEHVQVVMTAGSRAKRGAGKSRLDTQPELIACFDDPFAACRLFIPAQLPARQPASQSPDVSPPLGSHDAGLSLAGFNTCPP